MLSQFTEIKPAFKHVHEFKQGQDKFKQFCQEIFKNFKAAKILLSKSPQQKMLQTALFLAIANQIFQKTKAGDRQQPEHFISVITKYKNEILAKSKQSESSFEAYIQQVQNIVSQMNTNLPQKSNHLMFHTILAICNKTESTSFFGKGSKYSKSDLNKLSQQFKLVINLMDYDDSANTKKLSLEFSNPNSQEVYLLKAKNRYLILYPLQKPISRMRITQSQILGIKEVEQIFRSGRIKASSVNGYFNGRANSIKNSVDETQDSKANLAQSSSISRSPAFQHEPILSSKISHANSFNLSSEESFLRAVKVVCVKCNESFSQFDCLSWNYSYYCPNCIGQIKTDTSQIPKPRMQKYLKERNFPSSSFQITCPECGYLSAIKNYDPANKPKRFTCLQCEKIICIKHSANIYSCFCFCPNCRKQTISLSNINISYCQNCRNRHCSTCQQTSERFCKCICSICYKLDSKEHECEPLCHSCRGKANKMKACPCGSYICYSCYYSALDKFKELHLFPCARE